MINPDGTVVFESPAVTITPRTTRDDFLASPLFALAEPLNQNTPWSRYSFKPVIAGSEKLAGNICFCRGMIDSVGLSSMRPEFGDSWNNWSSEKEQARHLFHNLLLQGIFGRPPDSHTASADIGFTFPWGSVRASNDPKSGGCEILIRYAAKHTTAG